MTQQSRRMTLLGVLVFGFVISASAVGAADAPDFTKFGYPTVAASRDINPDEAITLTAGSQSVAIKPGTFDGPVTFDLLVSAPSAWQSLVSNRTVRAAFAFRVTDRATKAIIGTFKQPVTYTYNGADAQPTDTILNTSATTPPAITPNTAPIAFDGGVSHPFGGAGAAWLVVSAPTDAASGAAGGTSPASTSTARASSLLPALLLLVTFGGILFAAVMLVRKRPL